MNAPASSPGRFITLEGIEGVGKSSNLEFVRQHLEAGGKEVVVTREPGGTPLAEQVRELLLDHGPEPLTPESELLLMFAARSLHVAHLIRPALQRGAWVVCDRYTDATLAYQGGGRGLSMERIRQLADWVHGDLWPDLTLLLDAPVDVGLARAGRRGSPDRFETEQASFFARVRAAYLSLADSSPRRIVVIDASRPLCEVQRAIRSALADLLRTDGKCSI